MYYMGFSYVEAFNMPIWKRVWFIERVNKELRAANDAKSGASRANHDNSSEARALQGMTRTETPSRLRRFT